MMEASVAESQVDGMPWKVEALVTGLISLPSRTQQQDRTRVPN